tara:strand:+ start:132 stop:488 length:357 start_codon:yes stop_codon:yes gene_type:complete
MPKTSENQKSTAMDYLSAPRSEGLVVSLLALLGFEAPKGGRLPAGVKYDTIVALHDVFSINESNDVRNMISSRIAELQHNRKGNSAGRISASPTSIVNAVKSGKLSLDDLQKALASLE